jgi:exonuclease III
MSLNLFGHHGDWPARRELLAAGLRRLRPDVVALQEAVVDDTYDQAAELLGAGFHLAHQTRGRRIDYLLIHCGDHGPTLRIADCRRVFDEPVGGVWASDHHGVVADLTG